MVRLTTEETKQTKYKDKFKHKLDDKIAGPFWTTYQIKPHAIIEANTGKEFILNTDEVIYITDDEFAEIKNKIEHMTGIDTNKIINEIDDAYGAIYKHIKTNQESELNE